MAAPLVTLRDINLTFGGTPLLDGAELSVSAHDRLCLVGRNGSGKTTLLKIAAGLVEPDQGERVVRQRTSISYLSQEPDLSGFATTLAYVEGGLREGYPSGRARALLDHLGFQGNEDPATLSGGEARRCALARVLAPEPDVLFLDEPTNHLDLPAIEWLEEELGRLRSALVLISHDRRFLSRLSEATVWLDRGQTRRLNQGFEKFEDWRDVVLEQEELDRHKLDRKIAAEEDWVRYGVTARRKRNQGRMRALQHLRKKRRDQPRAVGAVKFSEGVTERSGKLVLDSEGISKSFGSLNIARDVTVRVLRGDRMAIVGPNGSGKTTLLKMLTGLIEPENGTIALGANLQMVTLDQRRERLDPKMSLAHSLTGGEGDQVTVGGGTRHVVSYMKDFLFTPDQAGTPVGVLSGGERGRLMLARALVKPSNLLVLDEPTNDLDLETLDLLQELLATYSGTVLLVSHDRDFLDRVASSVLVSEGDGRWIEYAGGYSDMVAQRGHGFGSGGATQTGTGAASRPTKKPVTSKIQSKQRLGFKENHALETLPGRIDDLEIAVSALRALLADTELFRRDPEGFKKNADGLEAAQEELVQAEDEWLRLETLREELEP
jgi:ATP-binding cassette subfamily F protein uup